MKTKPSIKKLGAAVALAVASSGVSATVLYDTNHYVFDEFGELIEGVPNFSDTFFAGNWSAGYFFVSSADCPAGCDLDQATILMDKGSRNVPTEGFNLNGYSLEIWSDKNTPLIIGRNQKLFEFDSPTDAFLTGDLGIGNQITFTAKSGVEALLQPDTAYWLVLTNISQNPPFGWIFNGAQGGEYYDTSQFGSGTGSPYIFSVEGTSRVAQTPIPGAVWMMGAGLIGLMATRRKVDQ